MFVAIKGYEVDGHKFIKSAVENGAKVILLQAGESLKNEYINI